MCVFCINYDFTINHKNTKNNIVTLTKLCINKNIETRNQYFLVNISIKYKYATYIILCIYKYYFILLNCFTYILLIINQL